MSESTDTRTVTRTCPLCEAGCGLEITLRKTHDGGNHGEEVTRTRGDRDDVFSKGFICPKGSTLRQLHDDPDRVRTPLIKRDGVFVPATWDEAFAEIQRLLIPTLDEHGRDSCAVYFGNPNSHNLAELLYNASLLRALGSSNIFSAATVDTRPKEISAALMFGARYTIPVPDLDRTDYVLLLGANPLISNGSLATAPDWPGRLQRILDRGGQVVVVDPRRTKTAELASQWVPIRPGGDAFLMIAMVQVMIAESLVDLGEYGEYVTGFDELARTAAPFTPEAVADVTGLAADLIRQLARDLAGASSACVYGRIGTTCSEFGTLASWLVDVLNIVTGNLDRPGGAMFALPATGAANTRGKPRYGREAKIHGRHASRVRALPTAFGELPAIVMAEEMDTPGEGRLRSLITIAANPVLTVPDSNRLDDAIANLDCVVAIDVYVNETTRHAHVFLPAPSSLQKSHYDIVFLQWAIRNVANFSTEVLPLDDDQMTEWEILARFALLLEGRGPNADPAAIDDRLIDEKIRLSVRDESSRVFGQDPDVLFAALDRRGPERIVDFLLRSGPYGDGFGLHPGGLTLDELLANPSGVDLGALEPRLPGVLRTPDGMIALAPAMIIDDASRLRERLANPLPSGGLELVGRRDLRSNNSWMHNLPTLARGKQRCTLQIHPDDATALGLTNGHDVDVRSRNGQLRVPVEFTDAIRRGVVSLPHGWGHSVADTRLAVAARNPGINANVLTDVDAFDPISGNAVLNGIPVTVTPVR